MRTRGTMLVRCLTVHGRYAARAVWECAVRCRMTFFGGASWQRRRLLGDEAVDSAEPRS